MKWKVLARENDDLVEQLLINRGVKTEEDREGFFNPKVESFEDDMAIRGISLAKERIEKAIRDQELIIAYGDYDVDGICGAAILYLGLSAAGAKVLPYIPHREKEGYGLSQVGLEFARDSGASLVITVDCGIVNFEQALFAKELGLDLIITDHHQVLNDKFPECFAVVHSTLMCGTAVAWCLVRQIISKEVSEELLDLVAIATIADMMPLVGLNRALVKEGLKKLNRTERVGLLALFNEAGISKGELGSYEIGHIIAPRLNAMGRLEHAIDSLRLICTKDPLKARKLADMIAEANNERKTLTLKAVDEAKLLINGSSKKIHVLSSVDWVPGIIGLVAGRVVDETKVPAIAISVGPTHSKGSARSTKYVNIVETIRQCSDILVAVGGHPGAAGFTIETSKIEVFRSRLEEILDANEAVSEVELEIEALVTDKELSIKLAKELGDLEPFGMSNPIPLLATENMRLTDIRTVGQGKHLKGKADGIDIIGFGMGDMERILQNGQLVNLAYNLEIDNYNGFEKLQLKVKDLQII